MSQLKHLSISLEQEYINPQVALEGLWSNLKEAFHIIFGNSRDTVEKTEKTIADSSGMVWEYFYKLGDSNPVFKTGLIASSKHMDILLDHRQQLALNWESAIKSELSFIESLFRSNLDKNYHSLLTKVHKEASSIESADQLVNIWNKHKANLIKTPISQLKEHRFLNISSNQFIQNGFFIWDEYKTGDGNAKIPCCTSNDFIKIKQLVKNLLELEDKYEDLDEAKLSVIDEHGGRDRSRGDVWQEAVEKGIPHEATEMGVYLVDYRYSGEYPYQSELGRHILGNILVALCHWVHGSIENMVK